MPDNSARLPLAAPSAAGLPGEPALRGARILVVSSEQPGRRMAGPAIRAVNLAEQLAAAGATVRLAAPGTPDIDLGLPVTPFGKPGAVGFRRMAREADLVVTQPQRVDVAAGLHSAGTRVVYDMYVPAFVEYPASVYADGGAGRSRVKLVERNYREYAAAVQCGDAFVVASQRQKDYLWGALGQAGRFAGASGAAAEPIPRVAVVPFGLPAHMPPRPATSLIKGPLVPDDAVVALWAGGLWNWFDPATVVRGLAAARRTDDRLRLVFLGSGHPSAAFQGQHAAAAALAAPDVRAEVASGAVIFAADWVPYQQRWGYLCSADIGVCAHYDSPETRMSFRTRLLDHLWAGLPTVTTAGGVLAERMCAESAALCVPAQDPAAWAEALLTLAADPSRRSEMGRNSVRLAREFTWPRVAEGLVSVAAQVLDGGVGARHRPGLAATASYLAVAVENRLSGRGAGVRADPPAS